MLIASVAGPRPRTCKSIAPDAGPPRPEAPGSAASASSVARRMLSTADGADSRAACAPWSSAAVPTPTAVSAASTLLFSDSVLLVASALSAPRLHARTDGRY